MNNEFENKIIEYRKKIANMNLVELKDELRNVNNQINKMILDSELVVKAAILNELIKDKSHD